MALPEDWTTQNTVEVSLISLLAVGGILGVGYVVWNTLPYLVAGGVGAGVVGLYAASRGNSA